MDASRTIADSLLTVLPLLNRRVSMELLEIKDEITLSQIRAIGQLIDQPITLSELAERRSVTRQAASLQVQGLVEKGWVRRIPDQVDRRSALLEVTDEGLAHWRETRTSLVGSLAGLFEQFTPEESAAFQTALPALLRILKPTD